jgi:uncharacterized membrane protein (DUF2068 family)
VIKEFEEKPKQTAVLWAIGAFKLLKGILLLVVGLAALRLVHRDLAEVAKSVLQHIRADPDSKFIHHVLAKLAGVSPRKLEFLGVGAFIYATLYTIEGIGLLLVKRWAEWMAVITTGGFLPLELYEVFHHPRPLRIVVLLVNVAIVAYLIWELRRKSREHAARVTSGEPAHISTT